MPQMDDHVKCPRGLVAGSLNAASPGSPASAAWRAITSACLRTLAGLHFLVFALLMLSRVFAVMVHSA
jgi:hypothetical protein